MKTRVTLNEAQPKSIRIIREGKGELFSDPDPDHAREAFRRKSGKMVNKVMPLVKAVERATTEEY